MQVSCSFCTKVHEPLPEITAKNSSKNTSYISSENSSHLPIHEDKGLCMMGRLEGGNKKIKSYQSCLEELRESTGYNEHMELGNKIIARTYDESNGDDDRSICSVHHSKDLLWAFGSTWGFSISPWRFYPFSIEVLQE